MPCGFSSSSPCVPQVVHPTVPSTFLLDQIRIRVDFWSNFCNPIQRHWKSYQGCSPYSQLARKQHARQLPNSVHSGHQLLQEDSIVRRNWQFELAMIILVTDLTHVIPRLPDTGNHSRRLAPIINTGLRRCPCAQLLERLSVIRTPRASGLVCKAVK